jgi:hypothetical protein
MSPRRNGLPLRRSKKDLGGRSGKPGLLSAPVTKPSLLLSAEQRPATPRFAKPLVPTYSGTEQAPWPAWKIAGTSVAEPRVQRGCRMGDAEMYDSMLRDGLNDAFSDEHPRWHTGDLAKQIQITREDQDQWTLRSQQRFGEVLAAGRFEDEIVPVQIESRKALSSFCEDEHYRPDTTAETLTRLKPLFRNDGTITAGSAPRLNSAGAAMIVADRGWAEKRSVEPLAGLLSYGIGASILDCSSVRGLSPPPVWHLNAPVGRLQTSMVSKSMRPSRLL